MRKNTYIDGQAVHLQKLIFQHIISIFIDTPVNYDGLIPITFRCKMVEVTCTTRFYKIILL